jgi:hypothetical protein
VAGFEGNGERMSMTRMSKETTRLRKITKGLEGSEDTQHKEDQTESS